MLLRASIRLRRVSRSRTSAIFSRRTRLQLIRSRLSILAFVSSSTRTVTSGTDDIPSIMYICLLRTGAASTVNRLVRPAFLTTGVPDERPDHDERRDEQRVERPELHRRRNQLERVRHVLRLRIRVRPVHHVVARSGDVPGVARAVGRHVDVFHVASDVGMNVERDGRTVALFADHDQTSTSPGPIGRPRVERYAWKGAFDVPSGVSTKLPLFETVPLPAPWAETVGAKRAAQTRTNRKPTVRLTQPAPVSAMWKVAMRSKPSTRVNRGSMRHVPGWDIANVVMKK